MKKILALALALIMVLALVPTSFAASITYVNSDSYTLTAKVSYKEYGSLETHKEKFEAKGSTPAMTMEVPFASIVKTPSGGLWDDDSLNIALTLEKFNAQFDSLQAGDKLVIAINGKTQYDSTATDNNATYVDGVLGFNMEVTNASYTTYSYQVVFTKTLANGDKVVETVNFSVTFKDNDKSKYDLKFIDSKEATLSDGIWYVDTASRFIFKTDVDDEDEDGDRTDTILDVNNIKFTVTKNDGSKFTTKAYYNYNIVGEKYLTADEDLVVDKDKSTIILYDMYDNGAGITDVNKTYQVYVTVEDQYGIYRGIAKIKYRNNVWRTDPKGVYFAQREYTIGVNEVLTPTYTTIVPTYHKLADYIELRQTANTEKSIFDIDDGKIIGKAEGVGYVYLTYYDRDPDGTGRSCIYTDTVKIIVKGTYQVVPDANYVVTASTLNVRSGAGTSYKIVGSLKKGAVAKVVEIKDGWAKIVTDKFTNQYVSAQYLQLQASGGSTPSTGTKTVIARVLNVRSGAGTGFAIVGKLNRGATVTVEEIVANGNWAKITFQGKTAYVHTKYIK